MCGVRGVRRRDDVPISFDIYNLGEIQTFYQNRQPELIAQKRQGERGEEGKGERGKQKEGRKGEEKKKR